MKAQQATRIGKILTLFLATGFLSGCASGAKILYDYDRDADFGAYRTYNFFEHAGPNTGDYQSFFTRYMIDAITVEMEKRGYTKSAKPDLLVNFNANLSDKTKVSTSTVPVSGGYYGYRGGYYSGWGAGYGYATDTYVSQYTEGTFNIDIVDNARSQLVWEAIGVARVSDEVQENLQQRVNEGVPKFFAGYPFVAGSSMPVVEEGK
jgi:hypothetical protein